MTVGLDTTEFSAIALNVSRDIFTPGARLFLLRETEPNSRAYEPVDTGALTPGEILNNWLFEVVKRKPVITVCALGTITNDLLYEGDAFGFVEANAASGSLFKIVETEEPQDPSDRVWTFGCSLLRKPFIVPITSGAFDYAFDYALG